MLSFLPYASSWSAFLPAWMAQGDLEPGWGKEDALVQGSGSRAALSLQIKAKLPQGWCVSTTFEVPSEEALLARRRSSISYMSHVEQGQEPRRSSCNGPHGGVVCHRRRWDISPQPTVLWRHHGQIDKWKRFPICQNWKCDGHLWKANLLVFMEYGSSKSKCSLQNSHRKLGFLWKKNHLTLSHLFTVMPTMGSNLLCGQYRCLHRHNHEEHRWCHFLVNQGTRIWIYKPLHQQFNQFVQLPFWS